ILPPAMRRVIEKDWNVRVVEIYGSNETLLMGVGCTAGRLHLCHDLLEFEVLDPQTQQPVATGEPGVLTVTSLVHEALPLVRYFTGDMVRVSHQPCGCGRPGSTAECLGRYSEALEYGGVRITPYELLDAAYDFADHLDTRIFFIVVLKRGLRLLIEVDNPERCRGSAPERNLVNRLQVPVQVEYVRENEVLDRSALFRGPKIYKPNQIADWRSGGRQPITMMEALLEWPKYDKRTIAHLIKRQLGGRRRRKRYLKEDAG
ncbi:MAG TPA: hypothetical protein VMT89_12895, partial [Candidatus Acidoferrales bacterium]|nr:hypothetical protein [Candidatus Acidoferrales bacterium]